MASLNKVTLIGNLGQDPEIKATQNGAEVANFSLACTERWKDKQTGETREKTEWVRCVVWNEHLVKVCKSYLKKGAQIYVEGKFSTRKWTDKDGQEKWTTEVVLENFNGAILMLGKKPEGESGAASAPAASRPVASAELDDEIPF